MANELLWKLLNGGTDAADGLELGALFTSLYLGGFCVLELDMDWELAVLRQGERAAMLEESLLLAAQGSYTGRVRTAAASDGAGRFCVLVSFPSRREYSPQGMGRIASQLADGFSSIAGVPVQVGIGGFAPCHELIPFSRREAATELLAQRAVKSVRGVLTYVAEHYSEAELNNALIAKACYLNYSYMCTHFHGEMGMTLTSYIRQYRMRKAVTFLGEAGVSVQNAAERTGYADPKYFAKCFRREFDMTPGEFQKRVTTAR